MNVSKRFSSRFYFLTRSCSLPFPLCIALLPVCISISMNRITCDRHFFFAFLSFFFVYFIYYKCLNRLKTANMQLTATDTFFVLILLLSLLFVLFACIYRFQSPMKDLTHDNIRAQFCLEKFPKMHIFPLCAEEKKHVCLRMTLLVARITLCTRCIHPIFQDTETDTGRMRTGYANDLSIF